jgi:DNA-binding XRE family transcriptional regulator
MNLSAFLKEYRDRTFISGKDLAMKLGVNKHTLEKWENAGTTPNHSGAMKLINYFGLKDLNDIRDEDLERCVRQTMRSPGEVMEVHEEPAAYMENKDLLLAEKDKRIADLEKLVKLLEEKIEMMEKMRE